MDLASKRGRQTQANPKQGARQSSQNRSTSPLRPCIFFIMAPAPTFKKPDSALVLLGHGSTVNPDSSAPTLLHADEIKRRGLFAEVVCAFWKEEPSYRQVLDMVESPESTSSPISSAKAISPRRSSPANSASMAPSQTSLPAPASPRARSSTATPSAITPI